MSSDRPAVRVRDLSKCYQIYARPADRLKQFLAPRLQRAVGAQPRHYFREFWALRDASFEAAHGESLGIIGRNGSGKSTLLQIICGTLTPTTGSVETDGRVAALLELGSGFNPEFSGRDNVYLNAALLGLSREQVEHRFDAIAAFADVGEHLEQPVKTYSSGMFVRLAFAVMAHVDADILVVDEALSVGDAVFTQRCMRFIRAFQERGTLLFVSHDTSAIQNLCQRAIWLDHGRIQQVGKSKTVSEAYLRHSLQDLYGGSVALKPNDPAPSDAGEAAANDAVPAPATAGRAETGGVGTASLAVVPEEPDEPSEVAETGDRNADGRTACNPQGVRLLATDNLKNASGFGTGRAQLLAVTLEKLAGDKSPVFEGGERVRLRVRARAVDALEQPIIGFIVRDRLGQDLFGENTLGATSVRSCRVQAGQDVVASFVFRLPMLPNGQYSVMSSVADGDRIDNIQHHYLHDALVLTVSSAKVRYGLVGIGFESVTLDVAGTGG